jgi:hypothetical protein
MLCRQRMAERLGASQPGPIDDRAQWAELRPVRWLDEQDRPSTPVLEIVSICKTDIPGLVVNHGHAFVRLVDTEGGIRPIGFFPDESTAIEPDDFPGLRMPGMLLLPDKYDRISWNPITTRIALSHADFDRICTAIERLQKERSQGTLSFDLLDRSCVGFVVRVARLAHIHVEAEVLVTDFLGKGTSASRTEPRRILTLLIPQSVYRLAFNIALAVHGGFCTFSRQWERAAGDVSLKPVDGIRPVFSRWRDVWSNHVPFYHVRALREWQRKVERQGIEAYRVAES